MMMMASVATAGRALVRRQPVMSALVARLSSMQAEEKKIIIPPNLKLDERCLRSKHFSIEPVKAAATVVAEEHEGDDEEEEKVKEASTEEATEEEDDDDAQYYFVPTLPDLVIPLPERLSVNILDRVDLKTCVGEELQLCPMVFGRDPIRIDLIKRVIIYSSNKKRGKRNAYTKTIGEVSGSGRKVRQQKGGGVARAGHSRPPHWRSGAKAHGPKGNIQDYTTKLTKRVRKLGLIHALSQKLKEGNLVVVNDFNLETHKTKVLARLLRGAGISGKYGVSALLVDWTPDADNAFKNLPIHLAVAAGNIDGIETVDQSYLGVYKIIKHKKLVMTVSAIRALEERLENVVQ